jgi:CRP-like cAMP-binding protein
MTGRKRTPISTIGPKQNRLLAALPALDYARLLPDLEFVSMPLGCVLCEESGAHIHYAYFPTTSFVSMFYETEDGASGEIAITGNEGMVGIPLLMGGGNMLSRALVASAGYGYRIKADILQREFALGGGLQHLVLCFLQALIVQMSQTTVCSRHHTLEQQLCRWLLSSLDRLPDNELVMTQELIASMLGVRREGVTEAAGKLQKDGVIYYKRGHITIVDRTELEKRVCQCYPQVKKEYDRLLPHPATLTALPAWQQNTAPTKLATVKQEPPVSFPAAKQHIEKSGIYVRHYSQRFLAVP